MSSSSNWIRTVPTHCIYELPVVERTSRTPANPARRFLIDQCRFYYFLDPEIRHGYYRTEMHSLYTQLNKTVTSDCYKNSDIPFSKAAQHLSI
ncbi:hypothetical protein Tco_1457638 [Tanacetum coccineum]